MAEPGHVVFCVKELKRSMDFCHDAVGLQVVGTIFDGKATGQSSHIVTQSLYSRDLDGNEAELYVDDPGYDWREKPARSDKPGSTDGALVCS